MVVVVVVVVVVGFDGVEGGFYETQLQTYLTSYPQK